MHCRPSLDVVAQMHHAQFANGTVQHPFRVFRTTDVARVRCCHGVFGYTFAQVILPAADSPQKYPRHVLLHFAVFQLWQPMSLTQAPAHVCRKPTPRPPCADCLAHLINKEVDTFQHGLKGVTRWTCHGVRTHCAAHLTGAHPLPLWAHLYVTTHGSMAWRCYWGSRA